MILARESLVNLSSQLNRFVLDEKIWRNTIHSPNLPNFPAIQYVMLLWHHFVITQQVSYDDGGSDSESGHDVYLERVKAEGQERDSEDGKQVGGATDMEYYDKD